MTKRARQSLIAVFIILLAFVLAWFGRGADDGASAVDDDDSAVTSDDDDSGDDDDSAE